MSSIGLKIRELRKQKGWSMDRLGEEIGKTSSSINGYEKGKNDPPLDIIVKLSQIFNVTLDSLMINEDPPLTPGDNEMTEDRINKLQSIASQSGYTREEQKAEIRKIITKQSTLIETEQIDLLINELLIQREKVEQLNELINKPLFDEMKEVLKKKLGLT